MDTKQSLTFFGSLLINTAYESIILFWRGFKKTGETCKMVFSSNFPSIFNIKDYNSMQQIIFKWKRTENRNENILNSSRSVPFPNRMLWRKINSPFRISKKKL